MQKGGKSHIEGEVVTSDKNTKTKAGVGQHKSAEGGGSGDRGESPDKRKGTRRS